MIDLGFFTDYFYFISIFLTTPFGIILICSTILVFFLYCLSKFNSVTKKPRKELIKLLKILETIQTQDSFRKQFERISKQFKESHLIGHQWLEYQETLLFDDSENGGLIRTVHSPDEYFTVALLMGRLANLRFFDSVPSILTGLGILGTFVGLTAGIYVAKDGIATQNTSEMLKALTGLLGGASMAFLTSITGILMALIFSVWEKRIIHRIQSKVSTFCIHLDRITIRLTREQLAFDTLKETRKQRVQLERFNTELAISIAEALDEKIAGSLSPSLNKLIEIMDDIRSTRSDQSENMIREITEQFKASMTDATGDELSRLSGVLEQVSTGIEQSLGIIKSSSESAGEQLLSAGVELNDIIKKAGGQFQEQMANSSELFTTKLSDVTINLHDALTSFSLQVERLDKVCVSAESLMDRSNDFHVSLGTAVDSIKLIFRNIEKTIDPIQKAVIVFEQTFENTTKSLSALEELSIVLNELNEGTSEASTVMKQVWNNVETRFTDLDSTLQGSFSNMQDGVDNYTDKIKDFVVDLDKSFSKAVKVLNSNIEELSEALEDSILKLNDK